MEIISKYQVESNVDNLAKIRNFVRRSISGLGMTKESIYDLVLAVDEAVTNIMVHGYKEKPGMINIEISQELNSVSVCLKDLASSFDPTRVHPPDLTLPLEQRPLGHMGVHLIHTCVDDMLYEKTAGGGNQLTLKKIISNSEPERRRNVHKTRKS